MSVTAEEIITAMGAVGKPSTTEVSSTDKTNVVRKALSRMNERVKDYRLRSFVTVEDQQQYDVNAATVSILYVWKNQLSGATAGRTVITPSEFGIRSYLPTTDTIGLSGWEEFTAYTDSIRFLRAWDELEGSAWSFLNNKMLLLPPPENAGDYVMYMSAEEFVWTTVPERFRDLLENLYAEIQLRLIMTKRLQEAGVGAIGQLVQYPAEVLRGAIAEYADLADSQLTRLEAEQKRMMP